MTERRCRNDRCNKPLDPGLPGQQRFCPKPAKCQAQFNDRQKYNREKERRLKTATARVPGRVTKAESKTGRATARRGPGYVMWCQAGWPHKIAAGEMTQQEVIEETGESQGNVSRWWAAYEEDEAIRLAREGFERAPDVEALLKATPAAFSAFRTRYFRNEFDQPYVTMPFHLKWIAALLVAIMTGGRQQILSPPRHGKTQLLIHFCVWLICRNPNIRIIWIGLNEDNAMEAVGAVLDILENHEQLRIDMLGPGATWKPGRRGLPWTNKKLTVANRTGVGTKAPTMRAIGKGGKLLSKDADWVIGDDIQDGEAYESPASRDKDGRWINTQVGTRKQKHTAVSLIGSRQHHEDIYGRLDNNPGWKSIVESAHSDLCPIPLHGPRDVHPEDCPDCAQHTDCMLWPDNPETTMWWLQDTRFTAEDDVVFEMCYLNKTRPAAAAYVTEVEIDACKNTTRRTGRWLPGTDADGNRLKDVHIPEGCWLVAGLDPATSGYQASVLWAFNIDTQVRHLIDVDNRPAGGLPGALAIIKEWDELYGCKNWVIEKNGYQGAIFQETEIVRYCQQNGVHLEPHFTSVHNKFDPNFGVTAQLGKFKKNLIDLPWGDEETMHKVRQIIKQWVNFEPSTRGKTDLVMGGWFPETVFRRLRRNQNRKAKVNYEQTSYDDGIADTYERVA